MTQVWSLDLHLKLCGAVLLALAALHAVMGRHLLWKQDLASLSLVNRQIFYVHTFFLALVLALLGALSLFGTNALLEPTKLALYLLGGVTLFWTLRLVFQFLVYSPQLWRGKRLETFVHVGFALLWSYLTLVYAWAWRVQIGSR